MIGVLIALVINLIVIFLASYILPGVKLYSFLTAVILAVVIGLANAFVHYFLYYMGVPPNFWTYGLLSFVLSSILIWIVSICLSGFEVDGLKWIFIFAFVISVFNAVIHHLIRG